MPETYRSEARAAHLCGRSGVKGNRQPGRRAAGDRAGRADLAGRDACASWEGKDGVEPLRAADDTGDGGRRGKELPAWAASTRAAEGEGGSGSAAGEEGLLLEERREGGPFK